MKTGSITFIMLLITAVSFTQEHSIDSLEQKVTQSLKEKFPERRFLNLEYGQGLNREFTSNLRGLPEQKKNIKKQHNFRAFINVPLYASRQWNLTSFGLYEFTQLEFDNISNPVAFEEEGKVDFHKFSTSLDVNYFSRLFNKPIVYNASIITDGSNKNFGRVKGVLGFTFILKHTARTTIALGAVAFIDPTSLFPVFPVFAYNHKFKNPKWSLDFILPQSIFLRREIGKKSRLSFGASLGSTAFYTTLNTIAFNNMFEYSQVELKTGLMYEHRVNKYLIGTVQGGFQNFLNNRLTEKSDTNDDYIYENKQDATGYFQIGISIDPFSKRN